MPAITEPYEPPAGHPPVEIDARSLTIEQIVEVARFRRRVALAPQAVERIRQGRDTVQRVVERREKVYGVTTGFGALCDRVVTGDQVKRLQRNLIISHASGVGAPFSQEVVRAMLLLRANTLASGNCGARLELIETLIAMLNKGVHPLVPQKGSVGASGDLVPSAHLALTLIGEGQAHYQGQLLPAREAMEKAGIPLVELEAKEGLALINGTQAMTAVGAISIHDSEIIMKTADIVAALTIDALRGGEEPFDPRIHSLRPHPGQLRSAANIRALLKDRRNGGNSRVQDAYSLRCIPAVHGASRDALQHARGVVAIECNAVTDNPLVFPETQEFLSCGNFHGQPIALAMDFLSIGLCEIANISERRIERLVNSNLREHLPGFLIKEGGLNSGFMITQYTAAALVSENKVLAHPASVDSIPTSANQEDHVSMGTISARQAQEIASNVTNVLAIEMFCAAQAIDFLDSRQYLGLGVKPVYEAIRKRIPYLSEDDLMYPHIEAAREMIETGLILGAAEAHTGRLE